MLKFYNSLFFTLLLSTALLATDHTITTAGLTFSPSELNVVVGDNVTIVASGNHPTTQVSQITWESNGTSPLAGGFGTNTAAFTFSIDSEETIYYVCDSHVLNGMKGIINVSPNSVSEFSEPLRVSFGAMPITDGRLDYTIEANLNRVQSIEVVSVTGQQVALTTVEADQGSLDLFAKPGTYIVLLRNADGNLVYRETIAIR